MFSTDLRDNLAVDRRRPYRDEIWRLASEGDVAGLNKAADLLLAGDDAVLGYDGHRARAFAYAVEGRVDAAAAALDEGRSDDWPFPAAYAADVARLRFLSGEYEQSLTALGLAVRGTDRVDPQVAELVSAVAARSPTLRFRAVRIALGGGTTWQRLRNAAAAASARPS